MLHRCSLCCFMLFFLCHASKFSEKWGWFTNRVTLPQSWVRTAPNFLNTTQSTRSSLFFEFPKSLTRWCQMHDSLVDPLPLKWFVKQQDRCGKWTSEGDSQVVFFLWGGCPKRHLYTFRFENISNLMRSLVLHWILIVLMPLGICWIFFKTSWWDCLRSFKRPPVDLPKNVRLASNFSKLSDLIGNSCWNVMGRSPKRVDVSCLDPRFLRGINGTPEPFLVCWHPCKHHWTFSTSSIIWLL